jgi:hypothetical protein
VKQNVWIAANFGKACRFEWVWVGFAKYVTVSEVDIKCFDRKSGFLRKTLYINPEIGRVFANPLASNPKTIQTSYAIGFRQGLFYMFLHVVRFFTCLNMVTLW